MTLLTYNSKYVIQSEVSVNTTSSTFVNDTEASQTFTLTKNQTVLVIYQANCNNGSTEVANGTQNAININDTDHAISSDSPNAANNCVRNCMFWIGTLGTGQHTITGRFASNLSGSTVTIDNRILLIYIFDGDEYRYLENSLTLATAGTATLVDDSITKTIFTPSASCKALYLYNCCNISGSEDIRGKKATINVAGTDYSQAEKSNGTTGYYNSIFTCYSESLAATSTTVLGRFAANRNATVTVNSRQLGILLLADSTLLNIIISDTQVSTSSSALIDDGQATISRTTTDTRELLAIAMGTKRDGSNSSTAGEAYGISVNAVDRQISRGSPNAALRSNSAATCYAINLSSGDHTVQGRFSNNTGTTTAIINSRRVIALWLYPVPVGITAAWLKG